MLLNNRRNQITNVCQGQKKFTNYEAVLQDLCYFMCVDIGPDAGSKTLSGLKSLLKPRTDPT